MSIFPFLMVELLFSWWKMDVEWLRWLGNAGVLYVWTACILSRICKWRSERLGLRYFYVIPVSNLLLRLILRDRIRIPKGASCYLIHVNTSKRRKSVKAAIQEMQADMQYLQNSELWGEDTIFIGNTFADLGTSQNELLQQHADIQVKMGTLLPLQGLMLTKQMILQQQKKVFGRVVRKDPKTSWRILVIRPKYRKESPA
ncbi:hypothetical protein QO009_004184 [Brevibacillus aydinogluensis]|uniref:hypothetical protein n=1 Tax=Brevibacillus aydinogluensis TaxID=927786 RepID=UPI002892A388|nr:hypothetical protein [Brevibacillus aydinogluensis]MDT3418250.1 hypothetical protein [Brevibacillus aydinogluensis]